MTTLTPTLPPMTPPAGLTNLDMTEVKAVFDLIQSATTRQVVKDFLKAKKLRFTASSWEQLYSTRIAEPIKTGALTLAELHSLLRSAEGFGSQHTFLFKGDAVRAKAMIAPERVSMKLLELDMEHLAESPLVIQLPDAPTIVDVHHGTSNGKKFVSIKEIEKRTRNVLSNTAIDPITGAITKLWVPEPYRAINFARLFEDGVLEIRLTSKDSAQYETDVARLKNAIRDFVLVDEFDELSIQKAKNYILNNQKTLKSKLRSNDFTLTNKYGTILKASAALASEDLADDEDAVESLNSFKKEQTSCTSSNIFFRIAPDTDEEKNIHVLLSGAVNEFALTASVTAEDYDYVLTEILELNK